MRSISPKVTCKRSPSHMSEPVAESGAFCQEIKDKKQRDQTWVGANSWCTALWEGPCNSESRLVSHVVTFTGGCCQEDDREIMCFVPELCAVLFCLFFSTVVHDSDVLQGK